MIKFSRPRRHVDHPVSARGMGSHRREELREALRGREANEALRKLAVRLVLDKGMAREAVADMPGRSVDWVDAWTERYREGGLAALRDLPRPGRPPKAPRLAPCTIVWGEHTAHVSPALLCDAIEAETGVRHRPTSVRRLLRAFGFSRKRPALVHVNRAGPDDIRGWQADTIPEPRRLAGGGHALFVQDESILVNGAGRGARHRSPVGERICAPHTGSHGRFAAFGALAHDGRQFFRTHGWFDAGALVRYLRETHRKFGRVAVVVDRAPQHRAAAAGDFPGGCGGEVRLFGLPTGSPHMNAMGGGGWCRARHAIRDSGHHPGVEDMRAAVGRHLGVTRHRLDIFCQGRKAVGHFA